jgi:hypothetical protein
MDLQRILSLREERAQLEEALRIPGRHALGLSARNAALTRIREIITEIDAIERPQETQDNPLDVMTVDELQALYDAKRDAYTAKRGRDTRGAAELTGIMTRIQKREGALINE